MSGTETGCDGGCITKLEFSDKKVPVNVVKDCIGGQLANLGDLNGDGLDEIGFYLDGLPAAGTITGFLLMKIKMGKCCAAVCYTLQ